MRFQVPQFIETETNIVGPFTLKQFLWIASGGAILLFLFMVLPLIAFIVLSIPLGASFGALAFVKIDNVPLFDYVTYGIGYALNPRRYFFKKTTNAEMAGDLFRTDRPTAPPSTPIAPPSGKVYASEDTPANTPEPEESPSDQDPRIKREYIIR